MRRGGLAAIVALAMTTPAAAYDRQIGRILHAGDVPAESSAVFRIAVDENGRPAGCAATRSSGNAETDAATCRYLMRQRIYGRQRDAQGRPAAYDQMMEIFREFLNRVHAERDAR